MVKDLRMIGFAAGLELGGSWNLVFFGAVTNATEPDMVTASISGYTESMKSGVPDFILSAAEDVITLQVRHLVGSSRNGWKVHPVGVKVAMIVNGLRLESVFVLRSAHDGDLLVLMFSACNEVALLFCFQNSSQIIVPVPLSSIKWLLYFTFPVNNRFVRINKLFIDNQFSFKVPIFCFFVLSAQINNAIAILNAAIPLSLSFFNFYHFSFSQA